MSTDHQSQASRPHRQTSDSPARESSDVPKANKKLVEIDNGWVNHLRTQARKEREDKDRDKIAPDSGGGSTVACPVCSEPVPNNIDGFRAHVQQDAKAHENILDETAMADAFKRLALNQSPRNRKTARKRNSPGASGGSGDQQSLEADQASPRGSKRLCSPPASNAPNRGTSPSQSNTQSHRSRARLPDDSGEFLARQKAQPSRGLYNPDEDGSKPKPPSVLKPPSMNVSNTPVSNQGVQVFGVAVNPPRPHRMMSQFKMEPITATQLVAEVKGIYHGLVLIESKAAEVDNAQSAFQQVKLSRDQWQALINLHRTLLYEHHDFFLASQHPASTVAMQKLSIKYAMPARMWRHGIHSFLELLRHRLPDSHEFMLTFIYCAYGMMTLLYETIPAHEDTWIECLGDLSRYRMAIEEADVSVREIWTNVSRGWYQLASDKMPYVGRLYHHMAILARPYALQQLFYYVKSLCVALPFVGARDSVLSLFDPLIEGTRVRYEAVDAAFVRIHGILFTGRGQVKLQESLSEYLDNLDTHIARTNKKWLENGNYTAISLACAMIGYGAEGDYVMTNISKHHVEPATRSAQTQPSETFKEALGLTIKTYTIAVKRWADPNTLSFIHVIFVFLWQMTKHPSIMEHIENEFPWKLTALMLNFHLRYRKDDLEFGLECSIRPAASSNNKDRPLPEDFSMRELAFSYDYFPPKFFEGHDLEEIEKSFETVSMEEVRKQRLLLMGRRIAAENKWLTWSDETKSFGVTEQFSGGEDLNLDVVQPMDLSNSTGEGEAGSV